MDISDSKSNTEAKNRVLGSVYGAAFSGWMPRLTLLAIIIVALAARFFWLDNQSLWGDEGYTWQAIRGSLPQTLHWIRAEGSQVPFYFIGQWAWSHLFGTSELGLRSFSAIAGVVGVWLVWLIGDSLLGRRAGWLAAALAAISPLWVYYSQEARPYALSAALATGTIACALRSIEGQGIRRGWLVGYLLCAAGAMLTHYFAAFVVLASFLAVPHTRFAIKVWLSTTVVAALPLLIWVGTGWTSFAGTVTSGGPRSLAPQTYVTGVLEAFANGLPSPAGLPTLFLILGAMIALIGMVRRRSAVLTIWLILVLLGAELVGFPADRPGPWVRYVIAALPAFILLEGVGLDYLWRWNEKLGSVALLLLLSISAFSVGHVYFDKALARFDFRTPVRQLTRTVTPKDRVIVNKGNPAFFYYYGDTQPTPVVLLPPDMWQYEYNGDPEQITKLLGPLSPNQDQEKIRRMMAEVTSETRRVYLIKYMPPEFDPGDQIENWLNTNSIKTSDEWIEHIRLISYDLTPNSGLDDPSVKQIGARLGDSIELLGWSLAGDTKAGQPTRATLFWQATAPVTTDFKVFVHVVPADDPERRVTQHDSTPGMGTAPPTKWVLGETVIDAHPLALPAGNWLLSVGMYDPDSGKRPIVRMAGKPDDSRVLLGPFTVR